MIHINSITRVQLRNLILIVLVFPLMSFHKAHNINNSINKWKQQNIFKSNLKLYSFEDILCLPSEELGLKTKINNIHERNSNSALSIKPANRLRVLSVNRSIANPNSRASNNGKSNDNMVDSSRFNNSILSTEKTEKESESRVSYQKKAKAGYSRLRPEVQSCISGLRKYDAPDIIITSTTRNWGGHGHRCGKALDWNYSKIVTSWLMSDLGQAWLDEYNMVFYIEDYKRSSKEMLSPEEEKHWRWIPWATNIHLHLNIKE